MEAENKLYAEMHGGDQNNQPSLYPPQYTETVLQSYPQYPSTMSGVPYNAGPSAPRCTVTGPEALYYTGPPAAAYGGGYGAPPQQQQTIVVAPNQPQPVVYVHPGEIYMSAIVYACVVLWCCNWVFGLIAYFLAGEQFRRVRELY